MSLDRYLCSYCELVNLDASLYYVLIFFVSSCGLIESFKRHRVLIYLKLIQIIQFLSVRKHEVIYRVIPTIPSQFSAPWTIGIEIHVQVGSFRLCLD